MRNLVSRMRPSPALAVAFVALVVALSGIAWAAATIGPKDIKRNAVRAKHIKRGSVKAKAIRNRSVTPAKLRGAEPIRLVGTAGQPQFETGGDGDCVWSNANDLIPGLGRVGFYKDPYGRVHLSGIAFQEHGPGGDGDCGDVGSVNDNERDQVVFILPPAYRPARPLISETGAGAYVIAGDEPFNPAGPPVLPVPPGGVGISSDPGGAGFLDGISFRAGSASGGAAASAADGAGRAPPSALESLGIELR